ncbi:MAG: hypothetical protein ACT4PV_08460 [Planctomycetaceae bacterium]
MRRRVAALLCVLCAAASAAERVFVELEAAQASCFVEEPIRIVLRIGFDAETFRADAVQLFPRRLDLPVQIEARWNEAPPGTVMRARGAGEGAALTLALDGEVAQAVERGERTVEGRRTTVVEIEKVLLATAPGELRLPAPRLRCALGTRFREDFLEGRVAVEWTDLVAEGRPLALTIHPLPEEGRPAGFGGAVGRFRVAAQATPLEMEAGASLQLVLRIEGHGNLERFDPPRLDALAGFHAYGLLDDRGAGARTITYDLAPLDATVRALPRIEFAYFDPEPPGAYKTAWTEAIPLAVRPRPGSEPTEPAPPAKARPALWPFAAAALALLALRLLLRARARTRREASRARSASRALSTASGPALADALAEFLAAHLHCPAAAVISPDLPARLHAAGLPSALASRAASLLERLVGGRYGGTPPTPADAAEAREVAAALERTLGGRA